MRARGLFVRWATVAGLSLGVVAPALGQEAETAPRPALTIPEMDFGFPAQAAGATTFGLEMPSLGAATPTFDLRTPNLAGLRLDQHTAFGFGPIPEQEVTFCCQERHLGLASIEIGLTLLAPWFFNRHVTDDSTAVIGWDSWKRNILEGMEWDHDNFRTNMFMHPYHGNLYFNAARSNGYNFWESSVFSWAGSFLWEMFGENNPGAANDWVATAVGGIGMGEVLWRSARITWDNETTGFSRTLRELGGFLLSPLGSASRLFRGEWTKVGPNPEGRIPSRVKSRIQLGARFVGRDGIDSVFSSAFFTADLHMGDPFREYEKPFDTWHLSFQLNGSNEKTGLGRLQTEGVLYGTPLGARGGKTEHVFHITQHFDYVNNFTLETGGSSVSADFRSRWNLSERWDIGTRVAPTALILWGTDSEYADFTLRDYDFGTGAAFRLEAGAFRDGNDLFSIYYHFIWQRNLNGTVGDHFLNFLMFRASWDFWQGLGLGAEYFLYSKDSNYRDFPDVFRRNPQARIFALWHIN